MTTGSSTLGVKEFTYIQRFIYREAIEKRAIAMQKTLEGKSVILPLIIGFSLP